MTVGLQERVAVELSALGFRSDDLDDDPIGDLDGDTALLLLALEEFEAGFDGTERGAFDETKHPRGPDGKFRKLIDRVKDALDQHIKSGGKGDPFEGFDREQLRKAAKARGIKLVRNESRESIAKKLIDDLGNGGRETPAPKKLKSPSTKKAPAAPKVDAESPSGATGQAAEPAWPAFAWPDSDSSGPVPMPVIRRETVDIPEKPTKPKAKAKRVTKAEFESRASSAASGKEALASPPVDVPIHETYKVSGAPDSWTPERTERAARGVAFYRASDYIDINDALRSGAPVSKGTAESIEGIDDVMLLSELPHDVVVHRGISNPSLVFGDAWKPKGSNAGLTWTEGAYSSTTADIRVARHFAGDDRLMMRILVPKGTPAVKLSDMSPYPKPNSGDEAEVLLDRGLTFRIVADRGVDPDTGIRMIDVAVS